MTANNETGVIQPMAEIGALCRKHGVLLHSDMVQSFGKYADLDSELDADSMRASFRRAHKFYGPKGAGFLYLRAGLPIDRIQFGGSHEGERRPGTENVPAIVGMAAAAEEVLRDLPNEQEREAELRDQLWRGIERVFPAAQLNAGQAPRLANTLNVSFPGFASETLLMALDLEGICASSGSACMVGSVVASHVLLAMGRSPESRRFRHSLLVRQRNDRARNRANGRGDRTHLATPKFTGQRGQGAKCSRLVSSSFHSHLPLLKSRPAAIRRSKRWPATFSSSRAQPLWPRRFVLNGRLVFAPPPAARNAVPPAFCSTAVSALTARLRLTGPSP